MISDQCFPIKIISWRILGQKCFYKPIKINHNKGENGEKLIENIWGKWRCMSCWVATHARWTVYFHRKVRVLKFSVNLTPRLLVLCSTEHHLGFTLGNNVWNFERCGSSYEETSEVWKLCSGSCENKNTNMIFYKETHINYFMHFNFLYTFPTYFRALGVTKFFFLLYCPQVFTRRRWFVDGSWWWGRRETQLEGTGFLLFHYLQKAILHLRQNYK